MEEENPWLDPEVVKHNNVKAEKPGNTKNIKTVHIDTIQKDEYSELLKTLVSELNLNKNSKKFAVDKFGEEWLKVFLKDVEDLKEDILRSKFFPSQKQMILLKFIFLSKQG